MDNRKSENLSYLKQAEIDSKHDSNKETSCDICGKSLDSKHLSFHLHSDHFEQNIECALCSKKFKTDQHFKKHFDFVHNDESHPCETCGKVMSSRVGLVRHINRIHKGIKRFKCDPCQKAFADSGDFKKHIKYTHEKERCRFKCELCEKTFAFPNTLRNHVKSAHKGLRSYECPKTYTNGGSLFKHVKTVHESQMYECDICHKTFSVSKMSKSNSNSPR